MLEVMKTYTKLPLDAVVALSKQKFEELISICTLDALVEGDRGKHGQTERLEVLLTELHALVVRVRTELAAAVRRQEAPLFCALASPRRVFDKYSLAKRQQN